MLNSYFNSAKHAVLLYSLNWRHDKRDGISNHQPHDCLLNRSGADQRKHQSPASLAFVRGIHQWAVNSPHNGVVTRKMFPFNDAIMVNHALRAIGYELFQKKCCVGNPKITPNLHLGLDLSLGDTGRDRWGNCVQGCGCLGQVSSQLPLEDVGWGSFRHGGAGRRFHSGMERFSSLTWFWVCGGAFSVFRSHCLSRLNISLVIPTSPFMILFMKDSRLCFLRCSSVGHFNCWRSLVTLAGW